MLVPTAPRAPGEAEPPTGLSTAAEARSLAEAMQPRPWPTDRRAAMDRLDAAEIPTGRQRAVDLRWARRGRCAHDRRAARSPRLARRARRRGRADAAHPPAARTRARAARRASGPAGTRTGARRCACASRPRTDRSSPRRKAASPGTRARRRSPSTCRSSCATGSPASRSRTRTGPAAVALLDERWRRRPVGLVSGAASDRAQPLLAELYYLERALAPYAELRRGTIDELLRRELAVLVLADVGALTEGETRAARRAGSSAAACCCASPARALPRTPPTIRCCRCGCAAGDRVLGGALSWEKPAQSRALPEDGPFAACRAARGDGLAPGAGRADHRPRRQDLGAADRRHAAGDRRKSAATAGSCWSTPPPMPTGRTCRSPACSWRCCGGSSI